MRRKNVYKLALIAVILFVFFAPVIPTSVTRFWLLPWRNQCFGGIPSPSDPQFQPVPVYASISYVGSQLLIDGTAKTNHGLFGLIIVPNDGGNTVQFPPFGYQSIACALTARTSQTPFSFQTQGITRVDDLRSGL